MSKKIYKMMGALGTALLLQGCSTTPVPNDETSRVPVREPALTPSALTSLPAGTLQFIYFGEDDRTTSLNYNSVKSGLDNLSGILKKECGIDLKYTLEKRPGITFSKTIEFPLTEKEINTPDGKISFIYDQHDLYQEFRTKQLTKKRREIFIIKTNQLGLISTTGAPKKVCGYANPDIQFSPEMPSGVKANIKNTILFNSDQSKCSQEFSFVIAHEVAHLLIQDQPDHMVADDLKKFYSAPLDNLIATSGGSKLSRKYQCPAIKSTLLDLLATPEGAHAYE